MATAVREARSLGGEGRRSAVLDAVHSRNAIDRLDAAALHRLFAETGDRRALTVLVSRYAGLARAMAARAASGDADRDDLVQVALYGLIRALERFDPDRGVAFSTFAHATIAGELKRFRRNTAWAVHVPRRVQEVYLRVSAAVDELAHELGRQPTVAELAVRAGCDRNDVLAVLEFRELQHPLSLDHGAAPDSVDRARDPAVTEPAFDAFERADLASHLLAKLDSRERELVLLRFGDNLTQGEIAAKLGISQMHVSRLLRSALARLRVLALER